ncbi:MAG: lactate utilization protein, partial [Chromatiales bacterium]|nr:lactate utilization protein [Chromatiales bacterium]
MQSQSHNFRSRSIAALADSRLQAALAKARGGFVDKRRAAIDALPEFEALRAQGQAIREHVLDHLDRYLDQYATKVEEIGGQVHWAETAADARRIIAELCAAAGAKRVTKGKSMVGEEVGLNEALEARGMEVVETDLGEYIIQLAKEPPSHIVAPAVHKNRAQVEALFRQHHRQEDIARDLSRIPDLVDEARRILREKFLSADVGITGANFLVAETGGNIIVTNEGNGDLTANLPKTHIVIAGIEKVVPTLDEAATLLRLLGRSATGQAITSYVTHHAGPRRPGDKDGPSAYHVVLVDNGRSRMLAGRYRDMLRCIRC